MRIRLADYVANFLVEHGVTDVFSVVGGGAMHLNDALGHNEKLKVTYNHHEQACAIAAEAYARIDNRIAAVCVTTGPGGTNALTGVVGGWLDSIPMFIISGQVRYDTTSRYALQFTETPLRAMGDQEYDIVKSVSNMTKYATMIEDPKDIRYALEKAWHLATTGRPGPVWIDIPVNFQGGYIETDELEGYNPAEDDAKLPPQVSEDVVRTVLEKIKNAKRPVFHAGYGIRLSGAYDVFRSVSEKLNMPIVTYWNAVDLIEDDNPLYCGRAGNMGDRPGNWAIQNADLILAVGTRISIRQTGYNWKTWARAAEVIMVDVDKAELKKPTIHVEMPVWADAKDFLTKLDKQATAIAAKLNQKLEEMYERIGDEIREQETLSMKMQVHDNFGRSLLSIRKILGDKKSPENMKEQLETLKQQVYILTNTTVANKENQYEDTERHAEELGISIQIQGSYPDTPAYRCLTDRAIRECVTNCARHAHGNTVFVIMKRKRNEYQIQITNDGELPSKDAKEGGGLSALRKAVEAEGGSMNTFFEPAFYLLLNLPLFDEEY